MIDADRLPDDLGPAAGMFNSLLAGALLWAAILGLFLGCAA